MHERRGPTRFEVLRSGIARLLPRKKAKLLSGESDSRLSRFGHPRQPVKGTFSATKTCDATSAGGCPATVGIRGLSGRPECASTLDSAGCCWSCQDRYDRLLSDAYR